MTDEAQTTEPTEKNFSRIASERLAHKFHGEIPEEQEDITEPRTPEEPIEDVTNEVTDEATDGTPEQPEEYQEYEISQIAQLLGVDESQLGVDEDGSVVLNGKVNGETVKARTKDLLDNYQMYQAADKRLEESKQRAKAVQDELMQRQQEFENKLGIADKYIENIEKIIQRDESQIDWKDLKENDPGLYAVKREEFRERRQELDAVKNEVSAQRQAEIKKQNDEYAAWLRDYTAEQKDLLVKAIPEWKDPETAKSGANKLNNYFLSSGFDSEELKDAVDHRLYVLGYKAMLYDMGADKAKTIQKKVVKIPKVLKPGAPKPAEQVSRDKINKQRQRLLKSGNIRDAHALLKLQRSA